MSYVPPSGDAGSGPTMTTLSILGARFRQFGNAAVPTSVAWPTANTAILIPFVLAFPTLFIETFFEAGTTPGTANYDLGIYRDDFTRIASLGATAAANTTDAILPVGGGAFAAPVLLPRGRFYLAMSAAAVTITNRALAPGNGIPRAFGLQQMASAHPLPATITPATMGATNFIPVLGLTQINNLL